MKVLILCLPGIGDALMATPMIKILKQARPEAEIDVACMFAPIQYVFKHNPYVNDTHFLPIYKSRPIDGIQEIIKLRPNGYDYSLLAFPSFRREYHLVQWLIGAKRRIAHKFSKGYINEYNFLDTDLIRVDDTVHNVVNNLNLLQAFDIHWGNKYKTESLRYDLILDQEDDDFGKQYINKLGWEKDHILGIHPGSIDSKAGLYKRWPLKNFVALINYILHQRKRKILLFFGPTEIDIAESIYKRIFDKENCKLVSNLKFNQSLGVLKQIDLLISNDNGFAHLANALGTRGIVLFGPTNPLWCSPYNKKICTVIRKATFEPWFRNDMKVTHPPRYAVSGMEEISVGDVLSKIA